MHVVFALTLLLAPFQDLLQTLPGISRDLYGIQAPDVRREIDRWHRIWAGVI